MGIGLARLPIGPNNGSYGNLINGCAPALRAHESAGGVAIRRDWRTRNRRSGWDRWGCLFPRYRRQTATSTIPR